MAVTIATNWQFGDGALPPAAADAIEAMKNFRDGDASMVDRAANLFEALSGGYLPAHISVCI